MRQGVKVQMHSHKMEKCNPLNNSGKNIDTNYAVTQLHRVTGGVSQSRDS